MAISPSATARTCSNCLNQSNLVLFQCIVSIPSLFYYQLAIWGNQLSAHPLFPTSVKTPQEISRNKIPELPVPQGQQVLWKLFLPVMHPHYEVKQIWSSVKGNLRFKVYTTTSFSCTRCKQVCLGDPTETVSMQNGLDHKGHLPSFLLFLPLLLLFHSPFQRYGNPPLPQFVPLQLEQHCKVLLYTSRQFEQRIDQNLCSILKPSFLGVATPLPEDCSWHSLVSCFVSWRVSTRNSIYLNIPIP